MERWENEIIAAVEAGEREFGRLDAHQTLRRNLERRCAEIVAEQLAQTIVEAQPSADYQSNQKGEA